MLRHKIIFYFRYIDDSLTVNNQTHNNNEIVDEFNDACPDMKFNYELKKKVPLIS
jgi:hypothetical protein